MIIMVINNCKNRIVLRYVNCVILGIISITILLLSSCNTNNQFLDVTDETTESTTEESTIVIDDLPEELQESMMYSPNKDFKKVGIREKKDVFCFAGDLILAEKPRVAYDNGGIDAIVDKGIRLLFNDSDFNIANLECAITDEAISPEDKEWTFALPTKYVKAIKEAGIQLLTLANNHILDFGTEALMNTIKILDENGILHIGAGKDLREASKIYIKEIEGKRYAFIGASAVIPKDSWKATDDRAGVANGYDTFEICSRIYKLKQYVDKVIVYIHWGKELEVRTGEMQRLIGRRLVDAGADLVVGTHAHVVQEIEYYNNVPIVYSLGNFVYGGTMRDMIILKATFDYSKNEKGDLEIRIYPGVANYQKVSRYYDETVLKDKIDEINRKNYNCYIDYLGIAHIENKVDEDIEFTVKPGIFETKAVESNVDSNLSIKSKENETSKIAPFEITDIVETQIIE